MSYFYGAFMSDGNKFNPGDVVQLKSGGPPMTVDVWNPEKNVYVCSYFIGLDHKFSYFTSGSLKIIDQYNNEPTQVIRGD
jgi:uncharacterized protein YodC (DUF2158 family)